MNFKMKAAVAALALTASMSASAAISNGTTGDSSLVLTLIDNAANISLTVDLGFSHTTFDRNSNFTWDITSGDYASAWNTFWTNASAANVQWGVASLDSAGASSLFTTKVTSTASAFSNTQFGTANGNFNTYLNAANVLGNHGSVSNGANTATSGNGYGGAAVGYGTSGFYGGLSSLGDTNGALGTNLNVWLVNSGSLNVVQGAYKTAGFSNYFNMSSNGTLTYAAATVAAVPEADTSAMLLAGLALMGFIARRRTAA